MILIGLILRFRDLQNYTTLKRVNEIVVEGNCFRDLQNYTTLKLAEHILRLPISFRDLQNYTTLKPCPRF